MANLKRKRSTKYSTSENKKANFLTIAENWLLLLWVMKDSNLRPSRCKRDALNQLS